jgi:flagellar motor switch protein FliN
VTTMLDTTELDRAIAGVATLLVGRLPLVFTPSSADAGPGRVTPPGDGSLALSAGLAGVEGATILLALPGPVIALLTDGPLGQQDLTEALTTVLADSVAPLAAVFGEGCAPQAPHVLPADLALESIAGSQARTVAVTLRAESGDDGLLLLALPSGELDLEPLRGGTGPMPATSREVPPESLDLLGDVEMSVTAVLGRTRLTVRHLLGLAIGHVVELDKTADSAVDLLVNGTPIARGEVVVVDDEFGVRITEILGRQGRA